MDHISKIRNKRPVVHCITNYVTANDVANAVLAIGASPMMADDPFETAEIVRIADALVINTGTISETRFEAMMKAGKAANAMGKPVVLDPAGVSASLVRRKRALVLLSEIKFSCIRGNASEIKALTLGNSHSRGVDAAYDDLFDKNDIEKAAKIAADFSRKTGAVTVISGAVDTVSDPDETFAVYNGSAMMGKITGSGCMLSALIAAFISANGEGCSTVSAALSAFGICGQIAEKRMGEHDGNASFRNYLIDAVYGISDDILSECSLIKKL
jgi:hydroxyethylthiazole kinase